MESIDRVNPASTRLTQSKKSKHKTVDLFTGKSFIEFTPSEDLVSPEGVLEKNS